MPDGVIGSAPNYAQAVEINENHWAIAFLIALLIGRSMIKKRRRRAAPDQA